MIYAIFVIWWLFLSCALTSFSIQLNIYKLYFDYFKLPYKQRFKLFLIIWFYTFISFGIVKFLDGVLQLNHIVKEYFKGTCGEINTKTPDPK